MIPVRPVCPRRLARFQRERDERAPLPHATPAPQPAPKPAAPARPKPTPAPRPSAPARTPPANATPSAKATTPSSKPSAPSPTPNEPAPSEPKPSSKPNAPTAASSPATSPATAAKPPHADAGPDRRVELPPPNSTHLEPNQSRRWGQIGLTRPPCGRDGYAVTLTTCPVGESFILFRPDFAYCAHQASLWPRPVPWPRYRAVAATGRSWRAAPGARATRSR